jgi:cytochrome c2
MFGCGRLARSEARLLCAFLAALALASCSSPEEEAKGAVRRELKDPESVRFGQYTLVRGNRACLAIEAPGASRGFTGERQAIILKAETHGENRKWSLVGVYEERHDECVARLTRGSEEPEDDGTGSALPLLASADTARGEQVFRKCAACHTVAEDARDGLGPNLWGTMGAPVGNRSGYNYSSALRAKAGGAWTWESMDAWLTSPRDFAPGTKMTFAGIKRAQDRADLLAYLNAKGDTPLPLPAGR